MPGYEPGQNRGRFAPSPTGLIHVGNARTALAAWLSVRSKGGTIVWRLEDLDRPRVVDGMAEAARNDLAWLGLDWDEGPDTGGRCEPYIQSARFRMYEEALNQLYDAGRLFPCRHSRKDLREIARAPHGRGTPAPYPTALRPQNLPDGWFETLKTSEKPDAAIRFLVDATPVTFYDQVYGIITQRVDLTTGDFVLKRRDGQYAYQLAVVVDDFLMNITEVVRGADLLESTGRQIQLFHALGQPPPGYAHIPLVVNARGNKLSKRDHALSLRMLRKQGVHPHQLAGYLGYSLGLLPAPVRCTPADLVSLFSWEKIPKTEWRLTTHLVDYLRSI